MPWHSDAPGPNPIAKTSGFTLLELLVVLAICGVLLAIVPSAVAGLPSVRFRAATADLGETLRRAHDDAIGTGQTIDVMIDASRRYYLRSGRVRVTFPPVVAGIDVVLNGPAARETVVPFHFFADGSATGGTITLLSGHRRARILVDWLTGRVRTDV